MNQDVEIFGLALLVCINVVVQLLNCVQLFVTSWTIAHQSSLSFTIYLSLLKLVSIESVMPSNHLMLWCPLLILLSIFHSIRVFFNEFVLQIRWLKNWSFSISPSNEYSGLISFRIDWFDLFALQGILKGLFHHHNLKASILWRSAFLKIQLSHPYMTTGKVMYLLFNTLSTFVITFLPRSKTLKFCGCSHHP